MEDLYQLMIEHFWSSVSFFILSIEMINLLNNDIKS